MTETGAILDLLRARSEDAAVLVTLIKVEGSSYRRPGARLLWFEEGRRIGGISGGCLEEDVVAHAREVLRSRKPKVLLYDTATENDLVWGTGTGCDGQVTLFLEYIPAPRPPWIEVLEKNYRAGLPTMLDVDYAGASPGTRLADAGGEAHGFRDHVQPPQRLLVFGAGDDAQPLVAMATILGWQVTVVDSRSAYATPERFPAAFRVMAHSSFDVWAELNPPPETPVVMMTHRYRDDRLLLPLALSHSTRYVGLLGPRKRTERLLAELAAEGFVVTDHMRRILHAPIGLNLGGTGLASVALAILAEVQVCLAQAAPTSLRDRAGRIHA